MPDGTPLLDYAASVWSHPEYREAMDRIETLRRDLIPIAKRTIRGKLCAELRQLRLLTMLVENKMDGGRIGR